MATIEDRLDIMELIARYGAGLDARDWELWRGVFTDNALFDLSSWNNLKAQRVDTARVVRAQARIFAELSVTQHLMSNFRITTESPSSGSVQAVMRAEHWISIEPDSDKTKRYTMFGYYNDKLLKLDGIWKIDEMHLHDTNTEGDVWVMEEASRRARIKKTNET